MVEKGWVFGEEFNLEYSLTSILFVTKFVSFEASLSFITVNLKDSQQDVIYSLVIQI